MKIWPQYYFYKKKSLKTIFSLLDFFFIIFGGIKIKPTKIKAGDKVLVVNFGGIGDVVLSEPLLRALHQAGAQVYCLASPLGGQLLPDYVHKIFFSLPWLSRDGRKFSWLNCFVLIRQLKQEHFDLALDIKGDPIIIFFLFLLGIKKRIGFINGGAGALLTHGAETDLNTHRSQMNLQLLAWDTEINSCPQIHANQTAKDIDLILHINSASEKNWPIVNWRQVAQAFQDKCIAVIGSKSQIDAKVMAELVDGLSVEIFAGLSLSELVDLINRAKIFAGIDSGPAHIASALGIPVVSIFSLANRPEQWAPVNSKVFVFNNGQKIQYGNYDIAEVGAVVNYIKKMYE